MLGNNDKINKCNICKSGNLILLETKLNIGGSHDDMYICTNCHVITNLSKQGQNLSLQEEGLIEYYKYTDEEINKIPENIEAHKGIVNTILPFIPDYQNKTILEIGIGRGFLLLAAGELGFKKVIGVDLNVSVFNETRKYFNAKGEVFLHTDIKDIIDKIDCIVMWHTLEHIFDPNGFFRVLAPKLNDDCVLYFQVPQYNQPYICDTHHYFYNEPSIRVLMERNGFKIVRIDHDIINQFMTVIAIKDSTNGLTSETHEVYIESVIKRKYAHLRDLEAIIKDKDMLIDAMRKTKGWRALEYVRRIRNRIFGVIKTKK